MKKGILAVLAFTMVWLAFSVPCQARPTDYDNDMMPNGWEWTWDLGVHTPDNAYEDPDGDGILNLFEFFLGSNPNPNVIGGYAPKAITVGAKGQYKDFCSAVLALPEEVPAIFKLDSAQTHRINCLPAYTAGKRIMIQGGWNSDFTIQDPLEKTVVNGYGEEIIMVGASNNNSAAFILDSLILTGGDSQYAVIEMCSPDSYSSFVLYRCEIKGNAAEFAVISLSGVQITMIIDSVIADNQGLALDDARNDRFVRIINSTITGNSRGLLRWDSVQAEIINSVIWGNTKYDISLEDGSRATAVNSIIGNVVTKGSRAKFLPKSSVLNVNPMFINPSAGDFRLQPDSPCINAGKTRGAPLLDFDGQPNVGVKDIGAYEFVE